MSNGTLREAAVHEVVRAVESTLADFLGAEVVALGELDADLVPFASVARDAALVGGKRLRPTFAYWGWRGAVGGDADPEPVLPALAALELLHTFALIHDDLMDAGTRRRGQPTAHLRYAAAHSSAGHRGDPARFGTATAVLAGDLCLVWADQLMAETAVPPAAMTTARRVYDAMRMEAMAGQYLDLLGEAAPGTWSTDRALKVVRYKSASYTIARPLQFGAALAGGGLPWPRPGTAEPGAGLGRGSAARSLDEAYLEYGIPLGEAFQLRDDVLGVFGDPGATGKAAGDDLRHGKPTTLLMLARELGGTEQVALIDRCLAAGEVPEDLVAALREAIAGSGALQRVERMIDERVRQATAALAGAPVAAETARALTELAARVAYRSA